MLSLNTTTFSDKTITQQEHPMNQDELSKLSDEELLNVAKNNTPSPMFDAFFIGFMAGIMIFSKNQDL